MTRIIAGEWRSRRLNVPKGQDIRPTTDRMRERLFGMIGHARYPSLIGARVLDLFAGTGALGLEALSRGAEHATFIEQSSTSLTCLKTNIETLGAEEKTHVIRGDAARPPKSDTAADIVFMDPPYRRGLVQAALSGAADQGWLSRDTLIVAELAHDEDFVCPPFLAVMDDRRQGQQRILFLSLDRNSNS